VLTIEVADARILGYTEVIALSVLGVVAAFVVGLLVRQEQALENLAVLEFAVAYLGNPGGLLAVRGGRCSFVWKSSQTIVRVVHGPCKVIASLWTFSDSGVEG